MARIPHKLSVYVRRFVNGTLLAEFPETSDTIAPGFDTWTGDSVDRPVLLVVTVGVESDGTDPGRVSVDVDEDGGTTPDYSVVVGSLLADAAVDVTETSSATIVIPPGAQYQISNESDPNASNSIEAVRRFVL